MVVKAHIINHYPKATLPLSSYFGIQYLVSQICSNNDLQQRVIENILDRMVNQKTLFFILNGKNLGVD
jgi:hypothetical protein